MLEKDVTGNPKFRLSLCEVRRKGLSYTIDTLKYFENKYGKKNVFYFIAGADTLKTLKKWKSVDQVLKKCRFVVATRPGFPIARLPKNVLHVPFEALDISSTQIREKETGKSIRN